MNRRSFSTIAILLSAFTLFSFGSVLSAEISISRIDGAKSGQRKTVTIEADSIASEISGFNLLIAHDQSLGAVLNIRAGDLHSEFGWEYFTYRLITKDTVSSYMPGFDVSLINIIGLASLSGIAPMPVNLENIILAKFDVVLAIVLGSYSDETWTPFSFFWRDCNDNVLTSINGDTIYTANQLFENRSSFSSRDPVSYSFPGFGIQDNPCQAPGGAEVTQSIDFVNSGIWSFVIDPVEECFNGDLNCNGIHYELADVVVFINIIIYGLGACQCPLQECMEQSDANCDGLSLSVADLVFMVRVLIQEESIPKPSYQNQFSADPYLSINSSGEVEMNSQNEIAAAFVRIYSKDGQSLSMSDFEISNPNSLTGQVGDTFNLLLADFEDNRIFDTGRNTLFRYSGDIDLDVVGSVVDIYGNETSLKLESATLPDSPVLHQNYPNPFNPSTTIEFSLPSYSEWQIEIYNVAGQLIKNFDGASVGIVEIEWDGTNIDNAEVASGVYFYKLITSDQTASRKMLLLK